MYYKLTVAGHIPANTECPFVYRCGIKKAGNCKHKGIEHPCELSCGLARAFDMAGDNPAKNEFADWLNNKLVRNKIYSSKE